jgi:hypothetical protein
MKSFSLFDRQFRRITAAIGVLLATVAPATLPFVASADQIQTRSIALSSATAAATNVTYKVKFTPQTNAGAFVLDFCDDSPLLGAGCNPPSGMSVASAASETAVGSAGADNGSVTGVTGSGHQVIVTVPLVASTPIEVAVKGITNPAAGHLYARIVTYADATDAGTYTSTAPDASATHKDDGGVALMITSDVSVQAAVLESLTFCLSGQKDSSKDNADPSNPMTANCGSTTTPSLQLGEWSGDVLALDSAHISTGNIYTQLSTNAVGGAVVSIKSANTSCGGLTIKSKPTVCDIATAGTTNTDNDANIKNSGKIGVTAATDSATNTTLTATGSFGAATGSSYDGTNYRFDNAGLISTYGSPILDTLSGGVTPTQPNNMNAKLTFGASVAPNTPAGLYSNSYSLIATGKF